MNGGLEDDEELCRKKERERELKNSIKKQESNGGQEKEWSGQGEMGGKVEAKELGGSARRGNGPMHCTPHSGGPNAKASPAWIATAEGA